MTEDDGFRLEGRRWQGGGTNSYLVQNNSDIELYASARAKRVFEWNGSAYDPPADSPIVLARTDPNTAAEEFVITNTESGDIAIFYGFDPNIDPNNQGRLKERTNRDLAAAGTPGTTFGYSSNGLTDWAMPPQGWLIKYAYYESGPETNKLKSVSVYAGPTDSDTLVQYAEYLYYGNVSSASLDLGASGQLVQVTVRKRASNDAGNTPPDLSMVRVTQYRYDRAGGGNQHQLQMVFESDAVQRIIDYSDSDLIDDAEDILLLDNTDDVGSGTTSDLLNFASRTFSYHTNNSPPTDVNVWGSTENFTTKYGGEALRFQSDPDTWDGAVASEVIGGSCPSCSGGGNDSVGVKRLYHYLQLANWYGGVGADQPNQVVRIVVEDTLDKTGTPRFRRLYGVNYRGTAIREAFLTNPLSPPSANNAWCTSLVLNDDWRVVERRQPSAHKGEVTSDAELKQFLNPYDPNNGWANDAATVSSTSGLVYHYEYDPNHGVGKRPTGELVSQGISGTKYYVAATDYGDGDGDTSGADADEGKLPVKTYTYPTKTTSRSTGVATSISYTFWDSGDTSIKSISTTYAAVDPNQNGSGTATTSDQHFDTFGRLRWAKDGEGFITYYSYHPDTGGLAYVAEDVDPNAASSEITAGSSGKWVGWTDGDADLNRPSRGTGLPAALELVTKREYDDQGRVELTIEAGDAKHYTTYEANRTARFAYWDSSSEESPVPIHISEDNGSGIVTSQYEIVGNSSSVSLSSGRPLGFTSAPARTDYTSWTRYFYNKVNGQLVKSLRYHDIPSSGDGTHLTNYYVTAHDYDELGRQTTTIETVQSTSGYEDQITQEAYDLLDRATTTKRDSGDSGVDTDADSDLGTLSLSGLQTVSENTFDGGEVGDSHITKTRTYHTVSIYTDTSLHRTFRGHLRGTSRSYDGSPTDVTPSSVNDIDWMGRTIATAQYTSSLTWSSVVSDEDYAATTSSGRNNLLKTYYDVLGRVYRTQRFPGTEGTYHFVQNYYYDRNGNVVGEGEDYSLFTETAYDGAGRLYQVRIVDGHPAAYSSGNYQYAQPVPQPDPNDMTGGDGEIVQISHTIYEPGSNNVIGELTYEANHNFDSSLGIDFGDASNTYVRHNVYSWYDTANRLVCNADYGCGDTTSGPGSWKYATLPARPSTPPTASSETKLVTLYAYDAAGRLFSVTDPAGVETREFFDDLGRRTYNVENYVDFEPPDTDAGVTPEDIVTQWTYNGLDQITAIIVEEPSGIISGSADETTYEYNDPYDASLVTKIVYPQDFSTGASIDNTYNLDGLLATMTDQRGIIHTFSYNSRRQLILDAVTDLPSTVDDAVQSIGRTYDSMGRPVTITSYAGTTTSSTVLNEVKYTYHVFGLMTKSEQDHEGAVSGGEPAVQYIYDTSRTSNIFDDGFRTTAVTYPLVPPGSTADPKLVYNYGSVNELNERMNRAKYHKLWSGAFLSDDDSLSSDYAYSGLGRVIQIAMRNTSGSPHVAVAERSMVSGTFDYSGFDRFGRTKQNKWMKSSTILDQVDYTYDYAGSRLTRDIPTALYSANNRDEKYTYDARHRLTNTQRGTYNTDTGNIDSGSRLFEQNWELTAQGNWSKFKQRDTDTGGTWDLDQTRIHLAGNQLWMMSPWNPIASYDAAGNPSSIPRPKAPTSSYNLVWDAWNRLAAVKEGTTVTQANEYDGLNRRIVRDESGGSGDLRHFYYNESWQVLVEADPNYTPTAMYGYHPHYIDAVAARFTDSQMLAYLQDDNFNVTTVADGSGAILERYSYTPYGEVTVHDPNFAVDSNGVSDVGNEILYTGRRLDPETGLQINRNRFYAANIGRWLSRDPIGYQGGSPNLYNYVHNRPTSSYDPLGLVSPEWEPRTPRPTGISSGPPRCGTDHFFLWYYIGGGAPFDLNQANLINQFRDEISGEMEQFVKKLRSRLSTSCDHPFDEIQGRDKVRYHAGAGNYFDPMIVMGGGWISVYYKCEQRLECVTCCPQNPPIPTRMQGRCKVHVFVNDMFTNPTDKGGYYVENDWPGATKFPIIGNWEADYTWSECFGSCDQ